jgi:hypothetical protein
VSGTKGEGARVLKPYYVLACARGRVKFYQVGKEWMAVVDDIVVAGSDRESVAKLALSIARAQPLALDK